MDQIQTTRSDLSPPLASSVKPASVLKQIVIILLILISCVLLSLATYLFLESVQVPRFEKVLYDLSAVKQENVAQKLKLEQVSADLARAIEPQKIENLQNALKTLEQRLQSLTTEGIKFAALSEAAYLVRLADRFLQYEQDTTVANNLLEQADKSLSSLSDPQVMPARASLATDRARLNSITVVDRDALWFRTTQLIPKVAQLPKRVLPQTLNLGQAEPTPDRLKGGVNWQDKAMLAFDELKSLVKIRQHDNSLQTLIDPLTQALLEERLCLMLESTRGAIISRDNLRYHEILSEALRLADYYLDPNAQAAREFMTELKALNEFTLNISLPDLTQTIDHLSQILASMRL